MSSVSLKLEPVIHLTRTQFYQLCQENPDFQLERAADGTLVIMSPTGGETGKRNSQINLQLGLWNEETQLGEVFDSSTGFSLPNGSDRSPDASWVEKSRWEALSCEEREKFIPLCPDFVVEIISPSDSVKKAREKMREYQADGCRLGWLINRKNQEVEIYRLGTEVEVLGFPEVLLGEDVLPGFILKLNKIFT